MEGLDGDIASAAGKQAVRNMGLGQRMDAGVYVVVRMSCLSSVSEHMFILPRFDNIKLNSGF